MDRLRKQVEAAFRTLAEFWREEIGTPPIKQSHAEKIFLRWVAGEVPLIVFSEDGKTIEDIACAARIDQWNAIAIMGVNGHPDAVQCRALNDSIIASVVDAGGTWPIAFSDRSMEQR